MTEIKNQQGEILIGRDNSKLINQIIQGDCLQVMDYIEDKSIDMILCDLPYGIVECKWDTIIPLNQLWISYIRIIKDNGAIVLTATQPFATKLIMSNFEMFKYEWIWEKSKPTGYLEAKNKPMRKHENILLFSKGNSANCCKNRIIYNPQNLIKCKKYHTNTKDSDNYGTRQSRPIGKTTIQEWSNYPNTILKFDSVNKTIHPTQKPLALFEYLIKTYTNENALILDNCIGSGTTAVAARNLKRNFIGIELDEKYYKICLDRLGNTTTEEKI